MKGACKGCFNALLKGVDWAMKDRDWATPVVWPRRGEGDMNQIIQLENAMIELRKQKTEEMGWAAKWRSDILSPP